MPGVRKHRGACAIALGLSLSGCAMDFGWLSGVGREGSPEVSELALESAVDLQAPEGLRAVSGELRMVPLKWEPLLVGDVGGYVIERASERDGHFEQLARIPKRLTTTYLDRETIPADSPVATTPDGDPIQSESQ
ncbi:MAG: hypothetical protein IH885_09910, partial [Myxococcales bacterium]|nr:hypothetical protein [Myxococcales bacterium]